jgi:hypothetical protein
MLVTCEVGWKPWIFELLLVISRAYTNHVTIFLVTQKFPSELYESINDARYKIFLDFRVSHASTFKVHKIENFFGFDFEICTFS